MSVPPPSLWDPPPAPAPYDVPRPPRPPAPGARSPGTGPRAAALAVALAAVLGLLGGGVGGAGLALVAVRAGWPQGWTAPTGATEVEVRIARELPRLRRFVERERGLAFLREDVPVRVFGDREFEEAYRRALPAESAGDEEVDYDVGLTYQALHIVDSADGQDDEDDAEGVLGYYDDALEVVVLRGTGWSASLEATLVHELVHVLQDQHLDLGARVRATRYDDESLFAFDAVIEGDATVVEEAYAATRSPEWRRELAEQEPERDGIRAGQVGYLEDLPYVVGASFARGVRAAGGQAALDRAGTAPPTTSEELYDPAGWLRGDPALRGRAGLPPPPEVGEEQEPLDVGSLGVLGLALIASQGEVGSLRPEAFGGWAGDRYVTTYRDEEDEDDFTGCVDAVVAFDTRANRDTAKAALAPWDAGTRDSTLTANGERGLRLRSCE